MNLEQTQAALSFSGLSEHRGDLGPTRVLLGHTTATRSSSFSREPPSGQQQLLLKGSSKDQVGSAVSDVNLSVCLSGCKRCLGSLVIMWRCLNFLQRDSQGWSELEEIKYCSFCWHCEEKKVRGPEDDTATGLGIKEGTRGGPGGPKPLAGQPHPYSLLSGL